MGEGQRFDRAVRDASGRGIWNQKEANGAAFPKWGVMIVLGAILQSAQRQNISFAGQS